ncbi:hypothetical protein UFOVP1192_69 [uncultured Caudovirales phage]|uniref:Uncharacterized protein n=1 Tax=uncultured Caudovirales phage TaxID=2100421 RepID=A0A6J5R7E2_9CAUD|nr:hypothetical protein UFOVP1192_69 [uncultured Caudovirales phage]
MGGKPKIDGGMTYKEQQAMLKENREYEEAQTLKREEKLAAAELQRKKDEADNLANLKLAESQKIQELNSAEDIIAAEQVAVAKAKTTDSSGGTTLGNQFYNSLLGNSALNASKQTRPK